MLRAVRLMREQTWYSDSRLDYGRITKVSTRCRLRIVNMSSTLAFLHGAAEQWSRIWSETLRRKSHMSDYVSPLSWQEAGKFKSTPNDLRQEQRVLLCQARAASDSPPSRPSSVVVAGCAQAGVCEACEVHCRLLGTPLKNNPTSIIRNVFVGRGGLRFLQSLSQL